MKKHYLYLFLLFFMFGCNKADIIAEQELSQDSGVILRSGSLEYTFFQNVESFTESSGDNFIEGEIYCSQETVGVFQLGCQLAPGATYLLWTPSGVYSSSTPGSSLKTITTVLRPGINHFSLSVRFSGPNQNGMARLVITSIGGSLLGEGYVDLVAQGHS